MDKPLKDLPIIDDIPSGIHDSEDIVVNEFTESSAQIFREKVLAFSKENREKPIAIYIDSYGGEADALVKMIETIDEVPNRIVTVVNGKAMSCGAILLSHGDIRLCGKHSRIMIHEVSSGIAGDVHDIENHAKETTRLNRHLLGLMAKNCGIKNGYNGLRKILKGKDGTEHYMNAEEAVKFGIVDVIGLPKIEEAKVYTVMVAPEKLPFNHKIPKGRKSESKR